VADTRSPQGGAEFAKAAGAANPGAEFGRRHISSRAMRFVRGLRRAFAARMAPGMSETLNRPRNPCNDCGTALDPDRYIVFRVNPDEMWTNGRADISLCRRCWADRKDGRPYERTKGAISET
jgi:hypothetical protein